MPARRHPRKCSLPYNSTPSTASPKADDSLIDAYHQAWEDHRDARAEDSDNFDKSFAESLAAETAMQDRFPDYQSRYKLRYP
jgi:hypothetical protein